MIVIALLSVMTAVGASSFMPMAERRQFELERAKVMDLLVHARTMANARRECVRAKIEDRKFIAESFSPGPGGSCDGPFAGPPIKSLTPLDIPQNITLSEFSNGRNDVVFNMSGGISDETVVSIQMRDDKSSAAQFRIYPAIGQIRTN